MLTQNRWFQRIRKRHLFQTLFIAVIILSQIILQFYFVNKINQLNKVAREISNIEESLLDVSDGVSANSIASSLQSAFSKLSVDVRLLDENVLAQTRQYFIDINTDISTLAVAVGDNDIVMTGQSLNRITKKLKRLERMIHERESKLTKDVSSLSLIIYSVLIINLVIGVVYLNRTFNRLNKRYRSMISRLLLNAKISSRSSRLAVSSKRRLLKSMRHELRAPIATVIGCLELISSAKTEESRLSFVRKSRVASFQLLHELDALVQGDDIDSHSTSINQGTFNLLYLFDQCAAEFSISCIRNGMEFDVKFLPQRNTTVFIDAQKFITMFSGLLFVAKSISLKTKITCLFDIIERDGEHQLSIQLDSSLVKLTQAQLDNVWAGEDNDSIDSADINSFARVPLIKHYGELLGARIAMIISDGALSIDFNMPIHLELLPTLEISNQITGTYALVDDVSASLDYLSFLIEGAGGKTKQFSSGTGLLSSLRENDSYTAIIMDIHMPDVSGIEVIGMLDAIYQKAQTPIIMVSADIELLNQTMIENHSVEQVFSKPIDGPRLLDTLQVLELQSELSLPPRHISVLLVEDDVISAEFVSHMLKSFGYAVTTANCGVEAIEKLTSQQFDVALLDLSLPDMSGYDIAEFATQQLSDTRRPILLALTANTLETDKVKSAQAGMRYHICKPVSIAELKKTIELSIRLKSL